MKKIYFDTNNKSEFIKRFPEILKSFSGKSLIISLIQESRELEDSLDILDMIIYDNSDYISQISDLEKSILELDDGNLILPSSYKIKSAEFDYEMLNKDLEILVDEEIDNIFVLFDNKLHIDNKPETIKIVDENSDLENNVIILGKQSISDKFTNIVGLLNDNKDDFNILIDNLQNNTYIVKEEKLSFFDKIKRIFSKNE